MLVHPLRPVTDINLVKLECLGLEEGCYRDWSLDLLIARKVCFRASYSQLVQCLLMYLQYLDYIYVIFILTALRRLYLYSLRSLKLRRFQDFPKI